MTEAERYYQAILKGIDVRGNLIELKRVLTDPVQCRQFAYRLGGDFRVLTTLLKHDDPKVRRAAAAILGKMETEDVLPFLFAAWEEEQTRYVRPAYLKAMSTLDVHPYLRQLRSRVQELRSEIVDESSSKHVREELSALQELLLPYEKKKEKKLTAQILPDVLLLTRRCVAEQTAQMIDADEVRVNGNVIRARSADLSQLMQIRTWQELLLCLPDSPRLKGSAVQIGRALAHVGITAFLDSLHEGSGAWHYRLEIRPFDKTQTVDARFLHTLCGELDRESGGELVNAKDAYEVQIRLTGRRDGTYLPLLKLSTIEDKRFRYRREYIADSLSPVTAAVIMQLASPWLKEGAVVLDPFCGAGTLLTERCYYGRTGAAYGTDIYKEAIDKARSNAEHAHLPVHYIQRDFFTFRHEKTFDEVFTDLPRGQRDETGMTVPVKETAARMLDRLPELLSDEALVVIYSFDAQAVRSAVNAHASYHIDKFEILNEKSGACVFVCHYHQKALK